MIHFSTYRNFRLFQLRDNEEIRKRFGDGIPDVAEIAKNMSLMFVNQHYSYTGPKPLSNQLIEVGGIHITSEKPLPEVSGRNNWKLGATNY